MLSLLFLVQAIIIFPWVGEIFLFSFFMLYNVVYLHFCKCDLVLMKLFWDLSIYSVTHRRRLRLENLHQEDQIYGEISKHLPIALSIFGGSSYYSTCHLIVILQACHKVSSETSLQDSP